MAWCQYKDKNESRSFSGCLKISLSQLQLMKALGVTLSYYCMYFCCCHTNTLWSAKSVGGGKKVRVEQFFFVHHPDSGTFINITNCISWQCSEASHSLKRKGIAQRMCWHSTGLYFTADRLSERANKQTKKYMSVIL